VVKQASQLFAVLALLAAPATTAAATPAAPQDPHTEARDPDLPKGTHAVRGVVKSIAPTLLVITRSTQHPSDLALVLTQSTLQTGTIAVGSEVSVRYRIEGRRLVAAAVVANHRRHTPADAF
jgi:hypothetical protein